VRLSNGWNAWSELHLSRRALRGAGGNLCDELRLL
jgi:hypothetical protein